MEYSGEPYPLGYPKSLIKHPLLRRGFYFIYYMDPTEFDYTQEQSQAEKNQSLFDEMMEQQRQDSEAQAAADEAAFTHTC